MCPVSSYNSTSVISFQLVQPFFTKLWKFFGHLKLWIAVARHNFKCQKIRIEQPRALGVNNYARYTVYIWTQVNDVGVSVTENVLFNHNTIQNTGHVLRISPDKQQNINSHLFPRDAFPTLVLFLALQPFQTCNRPSLFPHLAWRSLRYNGNEELPPAEDTNERLQKKPLITFE